MAMRVIVSLLFLLPSSTFTAAIDDDLARCRDEQGAIVDRPIAPVVGFVVVQLHASKQDANKIRPSFFLWRAISPRR
jgi:hypothetical protein